CERFLPPCRSPVTRAARTYPLDVVASPRSRFTRAGVSRPGQGRGNRRPLRWSWCTLIENLKAGAAVDDESSQDNEKHNCGSDRPPIIFRAAWIGASAIVAARVNHVHARV